MCADNVIVRCAGFDGLQHYVKVSLLGLLKRTDEAQCTLEGHHRVVTVVLAIDRDTLALHSVVV